jgi:hypothetical protein
MHMKCDIPQHLNPTGAVSTADIVVPDSGATHTDS